MLTVPNINEATNLDLFKAALGCLHELKQRGNKRLNEEIIFKSELIHCAKALYSEDGENPEYDRALVELVRDVTPYDRAEVTRMLEPKVI